MSSPSIQTQTPQYAEKAALNKRLETIGWALFLIMIGGIGLVPKAQVPEGLWSIGVGLIMLGLNAARYYYKIKMSGFTIVLGTGIGELMGADLPVFAILLILIGATHHHQADDREGECVGEIGNWRLFQSHLSSGEIKTCQVSLSGRFHFAQRPAGLKE